MAARSARGGFIAIFGLALAVRLAHLACISGSVFVLHPVIDPAAYDARAQEILSGKLFPDDVFFQDPLYPYLLAALKLASGGWTLGPYVGHAIAGALSCVLLASVGGRYVSLRAGFIAGLAAALYVPYVYLDGLLEKHSFSLLALLGFLRLFPDPGPVGWNRLAVSGFLLGCGGMLRGNFLLLIPAFALVAAWQRVGESVLRRCAAGALFGAAAFAPILPVTAHNVRASGTFLLTTAQAGTSLYLGCNPENSNGGVHHLSFIRQIPEFEHDDWKREAERRTGRAMTRAEVSRYWSRAAVRHITTDPGLGWWLTVAARKAELLVNAYEIPDNTSTAAVERISPVLRFDPVRFAWIGPLGLAGLVFGLLRPRRTPIRLSLCIYALTLFFFPISERFRALLAFWVLLGFGEAVDFLAGAVKEKRWRPAAILAGGALLLVPVVNPSLVTERGFFLQPEDTNLRPRNARLKSAHDEAVAWINAREWDRAEECLRDAMSDPWLAKKARLNLDLALVLAYGRNDFVAARKLAGSSVKALLGAGESVPDGYRLVAVLLDAEGKGDDASFWRAREAAANAIDPTRVIADARRAVDEGRVAAALGLLEETVFADQFRPCETPPWEAYELLARIRRSRGESELAAEVVRLWIKRGGSPPADLR